jgi:hypothetical protein
MNNDPIHLLSAEIDRLRLLRPIPTDRRSVVQHLRSEIDEFVAERPTSDASRSELGDVLAIVIHLSIIEGASAERLLVSQTTKLRRRLDLVRRGYSWDQAKVITARMKSADMAPRAMRARDVCCNDRIRWTGSFGHYVALEDSRNDEDFPGRVIFSARSHTGAIVKVRLESDADVTVDWPAGVVDFGDLL